MNIDLIWYFDKADWVFPLYRDGVRGAMEVLEERGHTVRWHLGLNPQIPDDSDFIILWDSSNSNFIPKLAKYPQRKGIILTTDLGLNLEALRAFNVVFAEAQPVVDAIKPHGIRVIKAFGTDTRFFNPAKDPHHFPDKIYDAMYPSTFSPWKRQNLFADKWGDRGLCIGTVQPDGWDILRYVVDKKTSVFVGYMPVEQLWEFYMKSKSVDITGYEGSGRTVIEAMSMNIPVSCLPDNNKCWSYIQEWKASGLSPRGFVLTNYSEDNYADAILRGAND